MSVFTQLARRIDRLDWKSAPGAGRTRKRVDMAARGWRPEDAAAEAHSLVEAVLALTPGRNTADPSQRKAALALVEDRRPDLSERLTDADRQRIIGVAPTAVDDFAMRMDEQLADIAQRRRLDLTDPEQKRAATLILAQRGDGPRYGSEDAALAERLGGYDRVRRFREIADAEKLRVDTNSSDHFYALRRLVDDLGSTVETAKTFDEALACVINEGRLTFRESDRRKAAEEVARRRPDLIERYGAPKVAAPLRAGALTDDEDMVTAAGFAAEVDDELERQHLDPTPANRSKLARELASAGRAPTNYGSRGSR
jgi:hypothetical protein